MLVRYLARLGIHALYLPHINSLIPLLVYVGKPFALETSPGYPIRIHNKEALAIETRSLTGYGLYVHPIVGYLGPHVLILVSESEPFPSELSTNRTTRTGECHTFFGDLQFDPCTMLGAARIRDTSWVRAGQVTARVGLTARLRGCRDRKMPDLNTRCS